MMPETKKVFVSKPCGFCFGVKNALDIVEEALSLYPGKNIYVVNEIVHNKSIVDDLLARGVHFVQDAHAIPAYAVVIFSAHGVAPKIRQEFEKRNIMVLDATCPLVQKVHDEVNRYADNGYHIIYICNKNHDEARGVIAERPSAITVIETEKDIASIPSTYEKYMVLTQTTLNMYTVEQLFEKIKQKIPQAEFPDKKDLCHTTTLRQEAVKENAARCDLFLIIGSQNSSNSQKLRDIALEAGCNAYLIDTYHDIQPHMLEGVATVCVTSGASAPDSVLEQVIGFLTSTYGFFHQ